MVGKSHIHIYKFVYNTVLVLTEECILSNICLYEYKLYIPCSHTHTYTHTTAKWIVKG